MQTTLKNASELGALVRLARKAQNIRQDDAADSIGVSENFLGKVESVQWGKLFQVLDGLGVRLIVDNSSWRPVQWFFDNLLPEQGQRQLLASDAFALLAHYGAEADALLLETEQENAGLSAQRPELRATFAGEIRCLRAIRARVAEQAQRLV